MKRLPIFATLFAVACLLAPGISKGQSVVFNFTQPLGYQVQGWTGNLATLFTANSANVTVDDLGIYNGSDTDYVPGTGSIEVGLYNITTSTQIGPTVTFAPSTLYTQQGYALFQTITPVTLTAGDLYEVDAVGYSSADPNGNSQGGTYSWGGDTLGGALSFLGACLLRMPIRHGVPRRLFLSLTTPPPPHWIFRQLTGAIRMVTATKPGP